MFEYLTEVYGTGVFDLLNNCGWVIISRLALLGKVI